MSNSLLVFLLLLERCWKIFSIRHTGPVFSVSSCRTLNIWVISIFRFPARSSFTMVRALSRQNQIWHQLNQRILRRKICYLDLQILT